MNSNSKVIGLTRLRIKPKSAAPEADALNNRPSELNSYYHIHKMAMVLTKKGVYFAC